MDNAEYLFIFFSPRLNIIILSSQPAEIKEYKGYVIVALFK